MVRFPSCRLGCPQNPVSAACHCQVVSGRRSKDDAQCGQGGGHATGRCKGPRNSETCSPGHRESSIPSPAGRTSASTRGGADGRDRSRYRYKGRGDSERRRKGRQGLNLLLLLSLVRGTRAGTVPVPGGPQPGDENIGLVPGFLCRRACFPQGRTQGRKHRRSASLTHPYLLFLLSARPQRGHSAGQRKTPRKLCSPLRSPGVTRFTDMRDGRYGRRGDQ